MTLCLSVIVILTAAFLYVLPACAERPQVKDITIERNGSFIKKSFTYNASGDPTLTTVAISSNGETWADSAYILTTYDGHNVSSRTIRTMGNHGWRESMRADYCYLDNVLTREIRTEYGTGCDSIRSEATITYRSGRLESCKRTTVSSNMEIYQTDNYAYYGNGGLLSLRTAYSGSGVPQSVFLATFSTPSADGRDTVTMLEERDCITTATGRAIRIFDSSGRLLSDNRQSNIDSSWRDVDKTEYRYDSSGRLILEIHYTRASEFWKPDYKTAYLYDGDRLTERVSSRHDGRRWREQHKSVFSYTGDRMTEGECTLSFWSDELVYEDYMPLPSNLTGLYGHGRRLFVNHYDTPIETSEDEDGAYAGALYPNPSPTGLFYIDSRYDVEEVLIYSPAGALTYAGRPEDGTLIDLSSCPAGLYIAVLKCRGYTVLTKIIKTDI